jgi:CRP-like cAMP-binding protein
MRGILGRIYGDGEAIVRQGEASTNMYVVQEGRVEVVREEAGREVLLRTLGEGEFVGEMGLFDRETRSATVRARGEARVLTVDRKGFLKRIQEDPTLAFQVVEVLSRRVRDLTREVAALQIGAAPEGRARDTAVRS